MKRAAICMVCVGLMTVGCSGEKPSNIPQADKAIQDSMSTVKKGMESAVNSIAEKAAATSKEQIAKQIDLLKTEFERQQKAIGEKAETLTGEAQTSLRDAMKELEAKHAELAKKWEAFSKNSGQAAGDVTGSLAKAIADMRDAIAKASSEFRKAEAVEAAEAAEAAQAAETPNETDTAQPAPKPQ